MCVCQFRHIGLFKEFIGNLVRLFICNCIRLFATIKVYQQKLLLSILINKINLAYKIGQIFKIQSEKFG
nr:MAG TPA: hypothetical protein [Caudoviricetes sp.]